MLARWNDFGLGELDRGFAALGDLRREMDRLFEGFERDIGFGGVGASGWPNVRIYDTGDAFRLTADVPGFVENELHVSVERETVSIRGERKMDVPEGYSVHRQERPVIQFARSLVLPARVDAEHVAAELRDGVLQLTLPKVAGERPREITVTAA